MQYSKKLYTKEQQQQQCDRWRKPLLDPDTKQPTEVEGCKTFQELLTKRLKEIEEVLLPKVRGAFPENKKKMQKIKKKQNKFWDYEDWKLSLNKKLEIYKDIWRKNAEEKFKETMNDIKKYGLENYSELTDTEKNTYKRDYAIDLRGAFLKESHFEGADCREAHFDNAIFFHVHFEGSDCSKANFTDALLDHIHFNSAICRQVHFEKANLNHVDFEGADCNAAHFELAYFNKAHFDGAYCSYACFDGASCSGAHFDGANCSVAHFLGANCWDAHFDGAQCNRISFGAIETIEKNIIIHRVPCDLSGVTYKKAKFIGVDTSNVDWSKNPGMKSEIEHQQFVHYIKKTARWWQKPLILLWRLTSNYGKSFWQWLGFCVGIIAGFTFLYWFFDCFLNFNLFLISVDIVNAPPLLSYLYLSVVTFSTLGFGDVTLIHWIPMILVMVEVILGYFMLGGLITFLVKWLGRK
jgi:uncharacterized protein YjbI with pentapeptide repeats